MERGKGKSTLIESIVGAKTSIEKGGMVVGGNREMEMLMMGRVSGKQVLGLNTPFPSLLS